MDENRVLASTLKTTRSGVRVCPTAPALERDLPLVSFRAIPCFRCFLVFTRFEQFLSLCFQIRIIRFVFLTIKTRVFLGVRKVVTVSGAGHLSLRDTVSGLVPCGNISILTE